MHLLRTLFFFEAFSHGGQSHICMGPIIDWLMPYRVSSSPLSYHTPNTIHPQDLSSCCLAFLSFLLCISYFNPLSSNPTYLMASMYHTSTHKVSPQVQAKFICQPSGAVMSRWACHHQTTPRCQNCKQYRWVWLKPTHSEEV